MEGLGWRCSGIDRCQGNCCKGQFDGIKETDGTINGRIGVLQLPTLKVWFETTAKPEQIEWFSLLGPITRLSVFPREFVSRC
jgi:hypothetical protein